MLSFGLLFNAILLALGVVWCYHVIKRWRSDLEELREVEDTTRRLVIVGMWAVTVVIAVLVVNFAVGLIMAIVSALGDLFY